jgi:hypothetical protein
LLRVRRERPSRCAAEGGYELASSDSHLTHPQTGYADCNMQRVSHPNRQVSDLLHSPMMLR